MSVVIFSYSSILDPICKTCIHIKGISSYISFSDHLSLVHNGLSKMYTFFPKILF